MKLSIVATLYRSSPYIQEFYERATSAAKQLVGEDYEIILVNDGSPDDSLKIAAQLVNKDDHIVVVDLSRNFGHHKAMMTGLSHACGQQIFLIDSDLEEEPEWLIKFSQQMANNKSDVVFGVQEERKGGLFERISGRWYYAAFRYLSGAPLPQNITTARLMSRRYVEALLGHKEREICISGLWYLTGFVQEPHIVRKLNTSPTTYSLRHKISMLIDAVTSFSNTPLILIFYTGVLIFIVASIYAAFLILNWAFNSKPLSGWTSVMASIWVLGGLMISFIGVIGIYISKIFSETKQRPYTIVRKIYKQTNSA